MTELEVKLIKLDGGTQARAGTDRDTVNEYVEALRESDSTWPFPPVVVYHDGDAYWLADGFHRITAARTHGRFVCEADIRQGTQRDAILHAAGANADHGLRRTPDDKKRAVQRLLEDAEWGKWSDREIARRCKVSPTFVGSIRKEVTVHVDSDEPQERTYTTKHGTTATMKTGNIGPSYEPIWKLERRASDWLDHQIDPFAAITGIKMRQGDGLTLLADHLKQQDVVYRHGDLWQACNNVFDQMRQTRATQQRKEKRDGLTKAEYAQELVPELVEFLRTYTDKHGRGWRQMQSVAAHTNSTPWQDITAEWKRRKIYYEDDILKDAIKLAFDVLNNEQTRFRSGFPETCPLGRNPVCGKNCQGCEFYFYTERGTRQCHHSDYQNEPGVWWCEVCNETELSPYDATRGRTVCRKCEYVLNSEQTAVATPTPAQIEGLVTRAANDVIDYDDPAAFAALYRRWLDDGPDDPDWHHLETRTAGIPHGLIADALRSCYRRLAADETAVADDNYNYADELQKQIEQAETAVAHPRRLNIDPRLTALKGVIDAVVALTVDKTLTIDVTGPLARCLGFLEDAKKALAKRQEYIAWLRDYQDDDGRSWHDLSDNQTWHKNSPCFQAFARAFPDEIFQKSALMDARAQLERETAVSEEVTP